MPCTVAVSRSPHCYLYVALTRPDAVQGRDTSRENLAVRRERVRAKKISLILAQVHVRDLNVNQICISS